MIDTCALISLSVTGVLHKCFEFTDISIPEKVKEELTDISQYGDLDGNHAKNILKAIPGKINVFSVKDRERVKLLVDNFPHINLGEAEVLILAEERGCIAITDDLKSLSELKENSKTQVYLSAYLFAALVLNGLFTKDDIISKIGFVDTRDIYSYNS